MTYMQFAAPDLTLPEKIDKLLALITTARCTGDIDEAIDCLEKLEEKLIEVKEEAETLLEELETYHN